MTIAAADPATSTRGPAGRRSLRWDNGSAQPAEDLADIREVLTQHQDDPGSRSLGWIHLARDQRDELADLADELHLDDHALEDLLADRERPKLDVGPDVAVLIARCVHFSQETYDLESYPVTAVISAGVLITIADSDDFVQQFTGRLGRRDGDITAGHLVYELLDQIVDGFGEAFDEISDSVDDLAERVFQDRPLTRDEQVGAFHLRRSLTVMRKLGMPMRDVTTALSSASRETTDKLDKAADHEWIVGQLPTSTARGFGDVADHVAHISDGVDGLREVMSTLIETNLSLADVRLNTAMKKLASWAALIAVPTLITGFMGMNVPYPGYQTEAGFIGAMVVMVAAVGLLVLMFRRRDWL